MLGGKVPAQQVRHVLAVAVSSRGCRTTPLRASSVLPAHTDFDVLPVRQRVDHPSLAEDAAPLVIEPGDPLEQLLVRLAAASLATVLDPVVELAATHRQLVAHHADRELLALQLRYRSIPLQRCDAK